MFSKYRYASICFVFIALIAIGLSNSSNICFAEDNEDTNDISIPEIKGIPDMRSGGERSFVKEIENHYDVVGRMDEVQAQALIVNDTYFKKAHGANISGTTIGTRVGLVLNQAGEIILCEPVKKFSTK